MLNPKVFLIVYSKKIQVLLISLLWNEFLLASKINKRRRSKNHDVCSILDDNASLIELTEFLEKVWGQKWSAYPLILTIDVNPVNVLPFLVVSHSCHHQLMLRLHLSFSLFTRCVLFQSFSHFRKSCSFHLRLGANRLGFLGSLLVRWYFLRNSCLFLLESADHWFHRQKILLWLPSVLITVVAYPFNKIFLFA